MTALRERRTKLTFETSDIIRERGKLREVVIEAQPLCALVRLKGTRKAFPISYAAIYHAAARIEAERVRAEKKAARKARAR